MCVIAMSGGIAAGKSAVAHRFEARGVAVFDADHGAREAIARGTSGFDAVLATFGDAVLTADGELNRSWLRQRIFDDQGARRALEAIIHPRVHNWLRLRVANATGAYCMLAIPLLVETWPQYAWVDRVLMVDVSPATQMERLMKRDGVERAFAERMLEAQASPAQRLALADDVIDNNGTESALDAQVAQLHEKYLRLAVKGKGQSRPSS